MKTTLCILALLLSGLITRSEAARPVLPAEVSRALDHPTAVTVYAVNPDWRAFHWWFSRWFHSYRIIGQVVVADPMLQRQVALTVKQAAGTCGGEFKCIYSPRHAVRLTSGSKTYDFLICFGCAGMEVYSGDKTIASLNNGGSPDALNRILHAARIRVAP
jgi:hypothetical protein